MYKITNRTNSPLDIQSVDGAVILPANGEINANLSDDYAELLRAFGQVSVENVEPRKRGRPRKESANG